MTKIARTIGQLAVLAILVPSIHASGRKDEQKLEDHSYIVNIHIAIRTGENLIARLSELMRIVLVTC